MCFPVNFVKFLRIPFFIEPFWWLLLKIGKHIRRKAENKNEIKPFLYHTQEVL